MKDEALTPVAFKMEHLPLPTLRESSQNTAINAVTSLLELAKGQADVGIVVGDWLRHTFGIEKHKGALSIIAALEADAFVTAVINALPKKRKLTAAEIAELKREHAVTVEPARRAHTEMYSLERKLSDLVNEGFGLTPEDVHLMWQTAPPRMPFTHSGLTIGADNEDGENVEG